MPAKNSEVNRSQAIRDMIAANPAAQSKEIITFLAQKGIKVNPHLVYFVRSKAKHQKRKQKRQRVLAASQGMGNGNPVELILKVNELAANTGGLRNLKRLVDALAE